MGFTILKIWALLRSKKSFQQPPGFFILQPNNSNEATQTTRCPPASGGEAEKDSWKQKTCAAGQFGSDQKITGTQWKNLANAHRITKEIESSGCFSNLAILQLDCLWLETIYLSWNLLGPQFWEPPRSFPWFFVASNHLCLLLLAFHIMIAAHVYGSAGIWALWVCIPCEASTH